jgi:hypothetical protein
MMCGNFRESAGRRLEINDVDGRAFGKVLDLWSGREDREEKDLREVHLLARIADRFQINEVASALEENMMEFLHIGNCGEMLSLSSEIGLSRLEAASQICEGLIYPFIFSQKSIIISSQPSHLFVLQWRQNYSTSW